jgi:hypothetical protein
LAQGLGSLGKGNSNAVIKGAIFRHVQGLTSTDGHDLGLQI